MQGAGKWSKKWNRGSISHPPTCKYSSNSPKVRGSPKARGTAASWNKRKQLVQQMGNAHWMVTTCEIRQYVKANMDNPQPSYLPGRRHTDCKGGGDVCSDYSIHIV